MKTNILILYICICDSCLTWRKLSFHYLYTHECHSYVFTIDMDVSVKWWDFRKDSDIYMYVYIFIWVCIHVLVYVNLFTRVSTVFVRVIFLSDSSRIFDEERIRNDIKSNVSMSLCKFKCVSTWICIYIHVYTHEKGNISLIMTILLLLFFYFSAMLVKFFSYFHFFIFFSIRSFFFILYYSNPIYFEPLAWFI